MTRSQIAKVTSFQPTKEEIKSFITLLEKKKEKGFSDYHNKDILATRNSLADIIELQSRNFDN
jgi:hypothetical protein